MAILTMELPEISKDLVVTGFGAVLGFLATIVVEQFKRRREPQKRLVWTATTHSADIALDDEMRRRLHISFDGTQVEDLTSVEFTLHNAGNTVIHEHQVRFEFPEHCTVLAADVHPVPEREMGAQRRGDLEVGTREAVFRISHLERGQRVGFRVVASGADSANWKTVSHNDAGDVEYQEGSDARTVSDADHVPQFLALLLLLLTLPPLFRTVASQIDFDLGPFVETAIYGFCLLGMFPHVLPACRTVRDALIAHRLSRSDTMPRIEVRGTDNAVVYGQAMHGVTINPDPRPPPPRASDATGTRADHRAASQQDDTRSDAQPAS